MVWNVKAAGGALYARGNIRLNACKVLENSAYFTAQSPTDSNTKGGAVYLEGTDGAAITHCYFARNYSHSSYGHGLGGAVYAIKTTVSQCEFEDCVALDGGGALVNVNGTVNNCQFTRCYAFSGGAVYNAGTLSDCSIFDCRGIKGGGLFNQKKVERVTVANCFADAEEFGADLGGQGGGIFNLEGEISGALVYNNKAFKGGGIFVQDGKVTHSTVVHNALRTGDNNADFGFFTGTSEAANTENCISGEVDDSNFKAASGFYGNASTPEQAAALRRASWALVAGSALAGKGYQAYTTAIAPTVFAAAVLGVTYYTLDGIATQPARPGIYIEVKRMSDGSTVRKKIAIK